MNKEETFFDKFGLSVIKGDVEVGETYPIYGMITKIISEETNNIIVEINFSIEANLMIEDEKKINILKERSFEPGIFVSKILSKTEEKIVVECSAVIFGKKTQEAEQ